MTQKTIKIFIDEICSEPPKKKNSSKRTDVIYIGDIWSLDIFNIKNYDPGNNRNKKYVLVVFDNFSKFGW